MKPFPPIDLGALGPRFTASEIADRVRLFEPALAEAKRKILAEPNHPAPAAAPTVDNVNRPAHYTGGKVECIDAIEAALTPEEFRGFCKGNALKYVWRERSKGGAESLQKAAWYLARLVKS